MGESLLTALSMDTATAHHPHQGPSTFLSMDTASHDDFDLFLPPHGPFRRCLHAAAAVPPDINVPLAADPSPPPPALHDSNVDMLDVGLGGPQLYDSDSPAAVGAASASASPPPPAPTNMVAVSHGRGSGSSAARKCIKRNDTIWGAWFFFTHYFRPVMAADKSGKKAATASGNGNSATLDAFLVQHDMENMYMWVFKERPENALGKMQLRSFMNGHSRFGEPQFPFSADKGFVRSHRMQRKHYRGLSNPQCLHGIEIVRAPNLAGVPEADLKRWMELTGRDANFSIPSEASDFESWRNLPSSDFELERPPAPALVKNNSHGHHKKATLNNSSGLNLLTQPSNHNSVDGVEITAGCNKRKKDSSPAAMEEDCSNSNSDKAHDIDVSNNFEPSWMNDFSGVMCHASGPVTAAKTIYEDNKGYLIIISLPFADIQRVKVSWKNTISNGIVKVSCTSIGRMPFLKRHDRTFKLVDSSPEHCPPGEFVREIALPTRIPEDATLEAYCDETCTGLEIIVPKFRVGPEEHEVRVSMRPPSSWCQ